MIFTCFLIASTNHKRYIFVILFLYKKKCSIFLLNQNLFYDLVTNYFCNLWYANSSLSCLKVSYVNLDKSNFYHSRFDIFHFFTFKNDYFHEELMNELHWCILYHTTLSIIEYWNYTLLYFWTIWICCSKRLFYFDVMPRYNFLLDLCLGHWNTT